MNKLVFAYCRVSTANQVEGGGFDRQLEEIERFCDSKGWDLIRPVELEQQTGTDEFFDRPKLLSLLQRCGPGTTDTIVLERIDRLGRHLIVTELFFEECRKAGVKVYAADSGEELVHAKSDPTRVLIRQVLGAMAQWNRSEIVKKLRAGRDRKRAATGRCGGLPKYGWAKDLAVREHQCRVIAKIHELKASGNSLRQIASVLRAMGLHSPRGNLLWSHQQIQNIIDLGTPDRPVPVSISSREDAEILRQLKKTDFRE